MEIGRHQAIEDLSEAVIVERRMPQAILEPGKHPAFLHACPHLIRCAVSGQHRQDECFDSTPTGKDMHGTREDGVVDDCRDVEPPSHASHKGPWARDHASSRSSP
jgi:hypothetical protein